jgi:eukaryotic-like serine/threonine-protein kinase
MHLAMSGDSASTRSRQRELFLQALEQPTPEARHRFLEEACAGNAVLRATVEGLLAHHRDDNFLETPAVEPPSAAKSNTASRSTVLTSPLTEKPGDRIARYKLLQKIGEGGVGAVFMAEQEEPIRRRVALKLIKPGMDTKSVIARFESERQALALMDHPNIARVLDAGATESGRPFFVMELVRGIRISDYCDQAQLPTSERLRLFIKVCQAIQHAHQKGIIHRDIKPSNILVTLHDGSPVPKIIDFGIAKATDQRLTDKTLFTQFQAFIGTPAYMSPEQAEMSGLDVDTRTDIYSLGVLLYEILTGKTPFDASELMSSGLDAMRRTIREQDPVSPSNRLRTMQDVERTTTAQRQQIEPAKLASMLQGDLDWIVLKALEKDRTRRYQTASDLAMDVQRYLDQEPVIARPPSAIYRFQKFVRRNRLAFAVATAFAAALIIGLALSTWQYLEKSDAYRRALAAENEQNQLRQEAEKARSLAETQALAARRKAYAADINLVQQALANNNLGRAQRLLDTQRPAAGQMDLRGWEWRYLWQHCQSDALFTLTQESNEISSVSASSDGRWLAVADVSGALTIWDLRARQTVARLSASDGRSQAIFSPSAPILAFSADVEGSTFPARQQRIRLWDVVERRFLTDLPLSGGCRGLSFATNGTEVFTVASDGKAVRWKIPQGIPSESHILTELSWFGPVVQMSPDFHRAAYGLEGGRLRVVDLTTDKELWTVQAADEHVQTLAFSPDGKILASGAGFVESTIRLWDSATGIELGRLEGHRTWVSALVFWPDGKTLASASADQTIRLWDIDGLSSQPAASSAPSQAAHSEVASTSMPRRKPWAPMMPSLRPSATLRGHKLEVWDLVLLPDKTSLVSGCKDGSVYVWDTTTLKREQSRLTLPEIISAWHIAPDSRSILTLDRQGRVLRWQGADFQERQSIMSIDAGVVLGLFSSDGQYVAVALRDGSLQVWSLTTRQPVQKWPPENGPLRPVAFLSPSNHVVVGSMGAQYLQTLDLSSGQEIVSWLSTFELGPRSAFAFSADAQWVFLLDAEGSGHLRNVPRAQETILDPDLKQIRQVAFSPDHKFFAAVSLLGIGCLWETTTATKLATLHGFLQAMNSLAFSPDGKRLAIGGDGNEAVKLWDLESLQEVLTLDGAGSMFHTTEFSPDGTLLASCNSKGLLHLWRAPSLEEIDREQKRGL